MMGDELPWYHTWSYGRTHLSDGERATLRPPPPLITSIERDRAEWQRHTLEYERAQLRAQQQRLLKQREELLNCTEVKVKRQLPVIPSMRCARLGCEHEPRCYAVCTASSSQLRIDIPLGQQNLPNRPFLHVVPTSLDRRRHTRCTVSFLCHYNLNF